MSLTNHIETKILKKLTGLERTGNPQTGTVWAKPSSVAGGTPSAAANNKLHLRVCTTSPGETGDLSGAVATNLFLMPFSQIAIGSTAAVFTPQFPDPLPADSDEWQFFSFADQGYEETASEVTSIALCDSASSSSVIWSENLTGSAVRKYRSIDELRLTSVTFGLTGTAICRDLASLVLKHIFSEASVDTFAEINTTYLAFYNGDPGFNGTDAPEQGTRVTLGAIPNSSGTPDSDNTWAIENGTASNVSTIQKTFTTESTVTHVAIRGAASAGQSNDAIYWRGPLLSPQKLAPSDRLAISPGQLALSID